MVYITIELNGIKILKTAEPEKTALLLSQLDTILAHGKFQLHSSRGDFLFYTAAPEFSELENTVDSMINAYDFLKGSREDLRGFLIFSGSEPDRSDENTFHKKLSNATGIINKIVQDETLWFSRSALKLFEEYVKTEVRDDIFLFVSRKGLSGNSEMGVEDFLFDPEKEEQLLSHLDPSLLGQQEQIIALIGPAYTGKQRTIRDVCRKLAGSEVKVPWMFIVPRNDQAGSDESPFLPVFSAFDRELLESGSRYLKKPELEIWEELYPFLSMEPESLFEEDIYNLFFLYGKIYIRHMEERLLPPIIGCFNVERMRGLEEMLANFFADFLPGGSIIPVLSSEISDLPSSFRDFRCRKIETAPYAMKRGFDFFQKRDTAASNTEDVFPHIQIYHSFLLHENRHHENRQGLTTGKTATKKIIKTLKSAEIYALMIVYISSGLLHKETIINLLVQSGIDAISAEHHLRKLSRIGLTGREDPPIPVFPEFKDFVEKELVKDDSGSMDRINQMIPGMESKRLKVKSDLFLSLNNYQDALIYLFQWVEMLLDTGKTSMAAPVLERISNYLLHSAPDSNDFALMMSILYLRSALYDGREELLADLFTRMMEKESQSDIVEIKKLIAQAEYYYCGYDYRKALQCAKSALMMIQQSPGNGLEGEVNILLGQILLGLKRIDEAKEYFWIAREGISGKATPNLLIKCRAFEGITLFIYGNFPGALSSTEKALETAIRTGRRDWQYFLLFLSGRINFELGLYEEASALFIQCLTVCQLYFGENEKNLVSGWNARAVIYTGKVHYGISILENLPENSENLLFRAEGLVLYGDYQKGMETINKALHMERDRIRVVFPGDAAIFETGFDAVEDRAFAVPGGHGVLFQLIRAFRGYLLCRNGLFEEGSMELTRLTREEKLSDSDPNLRLYYFFQALTLPEFSETEGLDRLTLLSKALKHVQEIAARIDNPTLRRSYLYKNYWNAKLIAQGRDLKLLR